MDQEFMDEIDRDLLENGPGEPPFIRLAKAEQSVRELTAERDRLKAEADTAKEELLKCVRWQHELRQQRAAIANQNRIQLTYLLECHRKGGITPLFLALEEYVQKLQGEAK